MRPDPTIEEAIELAGFGPIEPPAGMTDAEFAALIYATCFVEDTPENRAEDAAIRARWQASYDEEERQHREARARGEELWRAWQRRDP